MPILTFKLVDKKENIIKESHSLKNIWWYIKENINQPKNYFVEEVENGDSSMMVGAYYLTQNFKSEKSLPLTLTDIF